MAVFVWCIALCALFVLGAEAQGTCSAMERSRCQSPLTQHVKHGNVNPAYYTQPELAALCRTVPAATNCMERILPHCTPNVKKNIRSDLAQYNYICSEDGQRQMVRHSTCYRTTEVQEEAVKCIVRTSDFERERTDSACVLAKDHIQCFYRVAEHYCNRNAAVFLKGLKVRAFKPKVASNCDLNDRVYSGAQAQSAPSFVAFFAMTIASIVTMKSLAY